jgi:hypothetical protein
VELVVRAEGDQTAEGDADRVEHLRGGVHPNLCERKQLYGILIIFSKTVGEINADFYLIKLHLLSHQTLVFSKSTEFLTQEICKNCP